METKILYFAGINQLYCGKAVSITQHGCMFVALGIQHKMRTRHDMWSSVVSPVLPYFPTLSHKRHDFRKKKLTQNLCFVYLDNFCVEYFSL